MPANNTSVPFRLPKTFLRGRQANRVLPTDAFDAAGRKVLRKLFVEMARHAPGVSGPDARVAVHDMRVAVRRMRAAFDLFEQALPRKAVKTHGRVLKELGGLLGTVRDADVLIADAQAYQQRLPQDRQPAFQPLIEYLQTRRDDGCRPLLDFLSGQTYHNFTNEFPVFLSEETPAVSQAGEPSRVSELAPSLILERLAEVRSFDGHIESLSIGQLHGLRRSIKRLRYALECFEQPLGPQTANLLAGLKDVQTQLGKLNDADLAARTIQAFIDDWNTRQAALPAAEKASSVPFLPYLTETLAGMDERIRDFPRAWEQFNTIDFRRRLARAIARL